MAECLVDMLDRQCTRCYLLVAAGKHLITEQLLEQQCCYNMCFGSTVLVKHAEDEKLKLKQLPLNFAI